MKKVIFAVSLAALVATTCNSCSELASDNVGELIIKLNMFVTLILADILMLVSLIKEFVNKDK